MNYAQILSEFFESYNLVNIMSLDNISNKEDIFLSNDYFNSLEEGFSSDSKN